MPTASGKKDMSSRRIMQLEHVYFDSLGFVVVVVVIFLYKIIPGGQCRYDLSVMVPE